MLGRQSLLVAFQRVGVTEEGYRKLRKLKVLKKQSMMAIVDSLIEREFNENNLLTKDV